MASIYRRDTISFVKKDIKKDNRAEQKEFVDLPPDNIFGMREGESRRGTSDFALVLVHAGDSVVWSLWPEEWLQLD